MTCNKCGCAVALKDGTEYTGKGHFKEKYECANGHLGTIVGDEAQSPDSWNRYGAVFQ